MKVYLIIEQHRAEGKCVLAVLANLISQPEAEQLARERSTYLEGERSHWCTVTVEEREIEHR